MHFSPWWWEQFTVRISTQQTPVCLMAHNPWVSFPWLFYPAKPALSSLSWKGGSTLFQKQISASSTIWGCATFSAITPPSPKAAPLPVAKLWLNSPRELKAWKMSRVTCESGALQPGVRRAWWDHLAPSCTEASKACAEQVWLDKSIAQLGYLLELKEGWEVGLQMGSNVTSWVSILASRTWWNLEYLNGAQNYLQMRPLEEFRMWYHISNSLRILLDVSSLPLLPDIPAYGLTNYLNYLQSPYN